MPSTPDASKERPAVVLDRLTSLDQVRAIERDWRALASRAAGMTPFQEPEWLIAWYMEWAADTMLVIAARDTSNELIGVAPAVLNRGRIEFAGAGISDYLAPVLDPRSVDDAAPVIDEALADTGMAALLHDVPADSPWAQWASRSDGWMQEPGSVCPVVHLPGGVDAWRRQLSAGLRRNLRRYGERLVADGGARFVTVEREGDLPPALDALMRLHSRRWHERYAPGVFANPRVRRFHFAVAPILLRRGLLRLHVIAAGCDIIAAQYVLMRGRRAYSYVGGFDPSWGRYSPGALLMAYAIERAIEDGCETFDLLRGREAYKYEWGAVDERSLTFRRDAVRA